MNCKNDREFLNDLIEFYFNYETKGHFNIVDVDSYHRIHQVYKNLIQDKRISKNNWNYKKLMDKEVFDSYSKLGKDTSYLHEENDRGADCYEDGEFFVIEFHSFDISMLNSLAQINEELQDFHGDKIIIDISDNEGGSDIVWKKLVSYLSGADYRYKSKITGHGKASKKYVESYGIDVQGSESKFSYIDCIDIQSEKLFDFKKVYLIMGDKTFSAADSFARFSQCTGFATVIVVKRAQDLERV
ncbi:MAG: S41 family peptidase [Holdemanella porci]